MAGRWQPHNMPACCNWEVVLLVKWKNTSVITNCSCDWRDLLIRVVELPGNLEIIWTLSRSPELYGAIGQAGRPSSHRIWTLLSWPQSGSNCGWAKRGEKGGGKEIAGESIWMIQYMFLFLFIYREMASLLKCRISGTKKSSISEYVASCDCCYETFAYRLRSFIHLSIIPLKNTLTARQTL